ncbi:hypothetical protein OG898_06675 [Streptomyces sp. NBC_00193]|uniref:hypothetical protein n=1 Tax=Streptomyces sp. NBC_00193 TaxID=2975675 RepID=UPI00225296FB|nr:hypothetical protein [Streptomyces sp. NBC_00193]MCX5296172.1 hypothetical protein [Streptomyces sp. NBC_00193]
MRSHALPKSLLLAVLGCVVLSGCGTRSTTTDQALAGSSVSAAAAVPDAAASDEDQELRFMELLTRDVPRCNQYVAKEKGGLPEDLPEPDPGVTPPNREEEVPLNAYEECFGAEEAQRVGEAFKNTKPAGYEAMQKKLTELGYPAARIHRMPDHAGAPRARVDLRMMGGRLALEVTGTGTGVTVEAFGASEEEGVNLAEVKRKPKSQPKP